MASRLKSRMWKPLGGWSLLLAGAFFYLLSNPLPAQTGADGSFKIESVEGAQKPKPTERYLENALNDFLDGKPIRQAKTVARGCVIQFEGDQGADAPPVSYVADVAPVLQRKCVHCHSPGNIGSGAMTSYQKVKGRASTIEAPRRVSRSVAGR